MDGQVKQAQDFDLGDHWSGVRPEVNSQLLLT